MLVQGEIGGEPMLIKITSLGKRVVNLIKAVRQVGAILPGDEIKMNGEKPAHYIGAFEHGDIQTDYLQVHVFMLHDGLRVVLEVPSLNRFLGKFLY
jgi:hypothetical protein